MSKTLNSTSPTFIINSKYRDNLNEPINSFHYTINIDSSKNYNSCALTSVRMPKSWYTVEPKHKNNTFVLEENGVSIPIELIQGNYNVHSMKITIEELLNKASLNGWIYKLSFPDPFKEKQTFIYKFEVFKATSQPKFIFNDSTRVIEILGFNDNQTYTFLDNVLQAPFTVKFELTNFVTVKSSICNNIGNQDSDTSVLSQVDCSHVRDGETIIFNMISLDDASRLVTTTTQNVFFFSVHDDQDRPLELFDDWNMTLLLYEHDSSSSYIINDLKLKHLENRSKETPPEEEPKETPPEEEPKETPPEVKSPEINL